MTISKEQEAQILRFYHVEKWRVGTIARQLGVHRDAVDRVLSQNGLPKAERASRPGLIDPYLPFVVDTLKQYPTLTASRLFNMVRERGYTGGPDHFRHQVAHYRPRKQPEAYLRLKTLPGTGPGRLGALREVPGRWRPATADGVRDGVELVAADLLALLP